MKNIHYLILAFFLLIGGNTFSQDFAPLGAEWHYSKRNGNVPPNSEYYHCVVTKDTVYAGENARKIEIEHFRYSGDSVQVTPMFVFERNDSVFYYNDLYQRYVLLYDFTASTGDTLFFNIPDTTWASNWPNDSIFREVVDSITYVNISGKSLRKIHTSPLDNYWFSGGYTEYIGSELYILPTSAMFLPIYYGPLRCYQDSAIFIQFSNSSCKYRIVTSLEKNSHLSENIKVHPNPVDQYASIKVHEVEIGTIELRDTRGQLIKEFSPTSKNLDFSEIENGIYFIHITTEEKQFSQKLIVHH